jgi:hypothetical protein
VLLERVRSVAQTHALQDCRYGPLGQPRNMDAVQTHLMADLTTRQAESARLLINSARLVNRLQAAVHGDEYEGKTAELTPAQIQAAKVLLDKSLPSLQSADITAHSSPQIEDEGALLAKLQALIAKYPQLINQLAAPTPTHTPARDDPAARMVIHRPGTEDV